LLAQRREWSTGQRGDRATEAVEDVTLEELADVRFRVLADARFAKAAIELTAGAEALAFMCIGMIKFDKGFP
jgi:hypothetical protein